MTEAFGPLSELQALFIQLRLEGFSTADIAQVNHGINVVGELNKAQELLGVFTEIELGVAAIARGIVEGPGCFMPSRSLTPSEETLIPYILRGLTNQQIKEESEFSLAAVGNHISHMILKFGARDRMMLAGSLYKYQNL